MPMRPSHPGSLILGLLLAVLVPQSATAQGWQRQAPPALPAGSTFHLSAVSAVSAQQVWASGSIAPSGDTCVLRTSDGGANWALPYRAAGVGFFGDLAMTSASVGFAAGGGLKYTTDGGVTWHQELNNIPNPPGDFHGVGPSGYVYGLEVVDEDHLWTAGYDGAIAGVIFHRVPGRPQPDPAHPDYNTPWWLEWAVNYRAMYGIAAASPSVAWSVGYQGWIWKTVDGRNWAQQTSPTAVALEDVVAVDVNTAWAVGGAGTIVKTTDGGATWLLQSSGTTENLRRVAAVDANTAWAVGGGGTILRTTNGGATWTKQYSGTQSPLAGLVAVSATEAWAVGADNTILHTTDGGTGPWPAPKITAVSPAVVGQYSWPAMTITITGTGFRGGNLTVMVGSVPADTVTWIDETTIQATMPVGLIGTFDVTVTNEDGKSVTKPAVLTFLGTPPVFSYSAMHMPVTGTVGLSVRGMHLEQFVSAELHYGATGTTETLSPMVMTYGTVLAFFHNALATRPEGKASLHLRTAQNQGIVIGDIVFEPPGGAPLIIDSITPQSGPLGTVVTVTGAGFTAATTLDICGSPMTITSRTATQLVGAVLSASPGTCTVVVTNNDDTVQADPGFRVFLAPRPLVNGVTPRSGSVAGGTTVTITGTELAGGQQTLVTFDGYPAQVVSRSATQLVVLSPPHPRELVDISVVAADDNGAAISEYGGIAWISGYSYDDAAPAPRITSISPAATEVRGGTLVTIIGTNFPIIAPAIEGVEAAPAIAPPRVSFGGVAATGVTIHNANTITCVAPALAANAAAVIVITWPDDSTTSAAMTVTVMDASAHTGHDDDGDAMLDTYELAFGLDPLDRFDADGDPDNDGRTSAQEAAEGTHPNGIATQYLAEGATGSMFQTRLALANPGNLPAHALLRYAKANGSIVTQTVLVPATGRATVDVETVGGMTTAEFATTVEADQFLVVDRTLRWSTTGHYGSHAERSVPSPATTWYLAEGATHSGFDLFYLLQNPNAAAANVTVTYLLPSGAPLTKQYVVGAHSRFNIWVNVEQFPDGSGLTPLAATDVSAVITVTNAVPIIVERAVYLTRGGQFFAAGHESAGVTSPAVSWFLAEGNTGPYFDLFVLVANPGTQAAHITADYLLTDGTVITRTYTVDPTSRFNIWVDLEDPRLNDAAVSTTITSTNGVPVIVERAMWWPGDFSGWMEAHNSPGSTETATRWGLAEGEVGGTDAVETYILVANTSSYAGMAMVSLLFEDGTTTSEMVSLLPKSRTNVSVKDVFGSRVTNRRFAAVITSQPYGLNPAAAIVVERAMYSSAGGVWWSAGTNALATKLP